MLALPQTQGDRLNELSNGIRMYAFKTKMSHFYCYVYITAYFIRVTIPPILAI